MRGNFSEPPKSTVVNAHCDTRARRPRERERMALRTVCLEDVRAWHCRHRRSHHRMQVPMPIHQ